MGELVERDDSAEAGIEELQTEISGVSVENVDGPFLVGRVADKIGIGPTTDDNQVLQDM